MALLVLNPDDLDRELQMVAVYAGHAAAQQWLMTAANDHLLNLDGTDRDENFVRYEPELLRPGRYDGMPEVSGLPAWMIASLCRGVKLTVSNPAAIQGVPFLLPPWAEKALRKGKELWLFDLVRVRRRRVWKAIERIVEWFSRAAPADLIYAELSFEEAARRSR